MFALLISGIGTLVFVYAGAYLAGHAHLLRFYLFLLLFMVSMLGLVLADNLLLLFVFWELTSLTSFLLIGFDHQRPVARAAALQALLVTGAGELAMLAGLILLGQAGGTFQVSELLTRGDMVRADGLYPAILLLVFAGAFTKSAQVPFHFWLPNAMEAPTPVSAYLHSATMVKAGVYLLARLSPVLGGTPTWEIVVTAIGVVTMLVGAWLAIRHTDLKRILAYSTLSALGTLVMLLGLGTAAAVTAAMVYLLGHALYKGALFLVAGAIDHEAGTRDVEVLGGLRPRNADHCGGRRPGGAVDGRTPAVLRLRGQRAHLRGGPGGAGRGRVGGHHRGCECPARRCSRHRRHRAVRRTGPCPSEAPPPGPGRALDRGCRPRRDGSAHRDRPRPRPAAAGRRRCQRARA